MKTVSIINCSCNSKSFKAICFRTLKLFFIKQVSSFCCLLTFLDYFPTLLAMFFIVAGGGGDKSLLVENRHLIHKLFFG